MNFVDFHALSRYLQVLNFERHHGHSRPKPMPYVHEGTRSTLYSMSTSCERSECVSVACINILLDCLAFLFLELLLFCFRYRNSVRGLTQPSFLQFHRSMTVSVSRPPSAARRAFKEKWEPWAYGTVRHKLPGRGYRKRRNFVGIRKKHYDTERKQAPVKLVLTAGCGRGIAARRMFNVGDDVVEYGGCLVKTGSTSTRPEVSVKLV